MNHDRPDRRSFLQQAAAVGLTVGSGSWQQALAAPVPSAEIKGSVVSGKTPLANVQVSDGRRVVLTDASGGFRLRVGPDSGPFVFVTTPSDHWTDSFYLPTSRALQKDPIFRLQPRQRDASRRLVYMTDVHLGEGNANESYKRMRATIDEINSLDPLPDACWVGGDISLDHKSGPRYVDLVSRLKMPVRHSVGNHEFQLSTGDPLGSFQKLFGPTHYSWNMAGVHCITLDGCFLDPIARERGLVIGRFGPRELAWLAADLATVPKNMTTVVAVHIPLHCNYPPRRGTTAENSPQWIITNGDSAIDLLKQHDVPLVLQGHLHENQRSVRSGIEFVESVSVCGTWWRAKNGEREDATSGEPRGYRIVDWAGNRLSHAYRGSAESRVDAAGEIVGRPTRLPSNQDARVMVNIFDGTDSTRVVAQLDSRTAVTLRPTNAARHFSNLVAAHHWGWTIPASQLAPGRHEAMIRVEEPGRRPTSFTHRFTT